MRKIELEVARGSDQRIDRYLAEDRGVATRSQVKRLLMEGRVLVGGKPVKPSFRVHGGEKVSVTLPDPEPSVFEAEDIPLDVLYEDGDLLIVNKPAGMVVHPAAGVRTGTLVNALLAHCKDLSGIGGVARPGIVHRLDKGTSGLLIVAKHDGAHAILSRDLSERKISRTYDAVVWGEPRESEGRVETLIGRSRSDRKKMAVLKSDGRTAVTHYKIIEKYEFASRLAVKLETGRTHQIRVHLAHSGHPVFGDPTYGGRRRKYGNYRGVTMGRARDCLRLIDRQALHAASLEFVHPVKNKSMEFTAPLPDDMNNLISAMREVKQRRKT
ncbi:MAG: RluA family pseudouridine synthase [bacterium]|jgi:23S rRNA pseudouridine1911/1915/1917 synthase